MGDTTIRVPKQKRSIEKKNKIKKATVKLLCEKGYYNFSTKNIAKEANVSVGTIYSYYCDKKAICSEVINDYYMNIMNNIPEGHIDFKKDPYKIIKQYIKIVMDGHNELKGLHKELIALAQRDEFFAEILYKLDNSITDKITTILENNKDMLKENDIDTSVFILRNSIEVVVHQIKLYNAPFDERKVTETLARLICNFLLKDEYLKNK